MNEERKEEVRKKRKEKREARIEAKMEKRLAYYEQCLRQAKADIVPWTIPEDADGHLRRKMKRKYDDCIDDILCPGLHRFFKSSDDEIIPFFATIVIPLIIIAIALKCFNLDTFQMAVLCILVYTIHLTAYFVWQQCIYKGYRKRLKKAAECRAVCDVLEARIYE